MGGAKQDSEGAQDEELHDLELPDDAAENVRGGKPDKIGDIKGESLDDKHKDWIEVLR